MTVSSPINLTALQLAIYNWFVDATALPTIWTNQSSPQLAYPFGTLQITSAPTLMSPLWETRDSTDLTRPLGTEVKLDKFNTGKFTISCQAFTEGLSTAMDYMLRAEASLALESSLALLRAADIVVNDQGSVNNISSLTNDKYIHRANLDLFLTAPMSAIEYVGYIKTTEIYSAAPINIDDEFGDV